MQIRKLLFVLMAFSATMMTSNAQQNSTDPYKGSDQLIVFDSTFVEMTESGLCYTQQHIRYKALTTEGAKQLSTVRYDYDPLSADVQVKSAQVLKSDGQTSQIDPSSVIDYVAPARAIYWGARQKLIPVGRLGKNDMVDVVLQRKGFTYALLQTDDNDRYIPPMRGEFYEIIQFFGHDPILSKYYEVSIPSNKPVRYKTYNGDVQVKEENLGKTKKYHFSMTDILPLKAESNMLGLSDVAPKAIITTTMKWEEKSRWFYNVNEAYGSFTCTPELKILVTELLKNARTELDSVHALTHWVADNMRYSGLSMGKGEGYTLHNVPMNLTDRCGVCKDKASLLVAMLRAAGFKTYAAMTMAGSRIEDIPADQFNHSVAAVVLHDGRVQMLDPTWVPFNRELWSSLEQQQNYLIGTAEGVTMMETPVSDPKNHFIKISNKAKLDENGNLTGEFTITAEGQSDAAVRGIFTGPKYRREMAAEKELRKYHPGVVVTACSGIDDPYTYNQPVCLKISYRIPDYARVTAQEIIFNPPLATGFFKDFFWHLGLNSSMETRKYPFKTRCSQQIEETETIELPRYSKVIYQPEQVKAIADVAGSFSADYSLTPSIYSFKDNISINKRIFQAEEWPTIRSIVEQHKKTMTGNLVLAK